jgi:chromosome transmission fidelity protein 1
MEQQSNSSGEIHEVEPPYPSSSTIPFPFAKPYPQQAALMDAILQTLERIDDKTISCQKGKHRANIMMLESPTGTGKSLSLACASIAWLKYREHADLSLYGDDDEKNKYVQHQDDDNDNDNDSHKDKDQDRDNNKAAIPQKDPHHWLDAWAPQEEIEKEQLILKERGECAERAKLTRASLEKELNAIRHSIQNEVRITIPDPEKITNIGAARRRAREKIVSRAMQNFKYQSASTSARTRISNSKNAMGWIAKDDVNASKSAGYKRTRNDDSTEDDFCLDEYHSDEERRSGGCRRGGKEDDDSSDEEDSSLNISRMPSAIAPSSNNDLDRKSKLSSRQLLDGGQLDGSGLASRHKKNAWNQENATDAHGKDQMTIGGVVPGSGVRKIIYAARTHSQLSQFVGEVRRTAWGGSIRVVTLGGRKLLCGNKAVTGSNHSRSEATITEKCLDLQKGVQANKVVTNSKSVKTKVSCPLLVKEAIPTLALHMLAQPSDIEDLAGLGEKSRICSYYSSREALKAAEVVVVPYNTLLSKPARESIGLSLKMSLIIVDEAHNIPEALRSISSSKLTLPIIDGANAQLVAYVSKYSNRLAGRNLFYLGQIRKFLTQLGRHLRSGSSQRPSDQVRSMVTATELLFTLKLDNLNLFNIIRYLGKSRLSQKLHGFTTQKDKEMNEDLDADDPNFFSKHISCMSFVETFLKCLTSTQQEGRVVIEIPCANALYDKDSRASVNTIPCCRYLLLDPSNEFKNVLDEAHSVILAGGTLRPFVHLATELFGSERLLVEQAKISELQQKGDTKVSCTSVSTTLTTFTCGHVVPSRNVLMTCMSKGPTGVTLDFRHSSRFHDAICNELAESICRVAIQVPNGMVVFLPSYSYEAFLIKRWKAKGAYDRIYDRKKVFREPRSAKDVETTLASYAREASSKNGAILFCVVGGKMSEGINFANEMARCVFIVGLPYPDITDPELAEKMQLLDNESRDTKGSSVSGITGSEYYQNLCMRAVNQSIGRAIRHGKDYAAIILADSRYAADSRVWLGLPEWLRSGSIKCSKPFDENMTSLEAFYSRMLTNEV